MRDRNEEELLGRLEPFWRQIVTLEEAAQVRRDRLDRLGADLRAVLASVTGTRAFLAREVYRVPEEWLDDVLRLRLAEAGR